MASLARFLGWLMFAGSVIVAIALMPPGRSAPCYVVTGCANDNGLKQIAFVIAGVVAGLAWLVILDTVGILRAALARGAVGSSPGKVDPRLEQPLPPSAPAAGDAGEKNAL